ncbi:fimbrial protein [Stenotrophomonas sp.]|uniref:fimbrial protein n=1 Tax=Stenotrophomonas sp. TaxID=69392 RepID=UPI0028B051EC|nr:fimbrial protein [Stenotrophomonas sp.]
MRHSSTAITVMLGLNLTAGAHAACQQIGGDAWIDHELEVTFTEQPDRWLGRVEGMVALLCDDAGDDAYDMLPTLAGLRYVREINVWGYPGAAYELSPESPLIVLTYGQAACDEMMPECGMEEQPVGDFSLRDGVLRQAGIGTGARKEIYLEVTAYSRGGQMQPLSPRSAGMVTTTIGGSSARHHLNLGFRFRAQTCAVTPHDVVLDDVDARTLDVQGTAGSKDFNVTVNCAAGGRPLTLELRDVNDLASTADSLAPAPGTTASGVVLQILQQGVPVVMQRPWTSGDTVAGGLQVPFQARYVRTADSLRTGLIKGEAVLTAEYR